MWAYREMLMGHSRWKEDVGYNLKNILFFIPFGMTFPEMSKLHFSFVLVNRRWLVVMLAGIMLSIFIEITQYVFCLGLCELDDVLCNVLGALLGLWLDILFFKNKSR